MGPLVPEIISNELNLVVAFFVGIGFGYVLEQAGFSSTKKLVGLFYGYDFTVLRVFFTAGVTAMIGVLLLSHFNLLNIDIIYVNPTFLWSALVGGGIMGLGFVIGGFCPGTSVCAAAAGKLDAMVFILGSVLGVIAFTETYPLVENLYLAENWGAVRFDKFLGISPEFFAVIITVIAVGAFVAVRFVESKVNKVEFKFSFGKAKSKFVFAAIPVLILLITAFTPSSKELIDNEIENNLADENYIYNKCSSDKLLSELSANHNKINLIDLRSPEEFKREHIPLAINIPLKDLRNYEWLDYFKQTFKTNIFYSDNIEDAKRAYLMSNYLGESDKCILTETMEGYKNLIMEGHSPVPPDNVSPHRWREDTNQKLIAKEKFLSKFSTTVKKKVMVAKGGCS